MNDPDDAIRAVLTDFDWAAESGRLELLGYDVSFRSTEPAIAQMVRALYPAASTPGPAAHALSVVGHRTPGGGLHYTLHDDATELLATPAPSVVLAHVLWHANRQAIDQTRDAALIHAAAAERDGRAVLIPGAMGAGKSTLVAGLVERGFGYLTDEIVAIDHATGRVRPYAKYLSLDHGARHLLPRFAAVDAVASTEFPSERWLVAPDALGAASLGRSCRPGALVAVQFRAGAPTTLEPLSAAEAAFELARHAYHLDAEASTILPTLARAVTGIPCVRLVSGDLAGACSAVTELLDHALEPAVGA